MINRVLFVTCVWNTDYVVFLLMKIKSHFASYINGAADEYLLRSII